MISLQSKGSFKNSIRFLQFIDKLGYTTKFDEYGARGVEALRAATPKRTGKTADSWEYKVENSLNEIKITWTNSNRAENGTPIAILIQYGHGTGWGKYVKGIDYINPALKPIFDELAFEVWEEVTNA